MALIQFAITTGAFAGGLLFDHVGWWSPFVLSAAVFCISSVLAVALMRSRAITH